MRLVKKKEEREEKEWPSGKRLRQWERKRRLMMLIFSLQCFCLGMDYSSSFISVWLYLKNVIKPANPKYFYILICSAYHISAIVISVYLGKFVDQNRSVRKVFLCVNMLVILGNIIYAISFSPWLPVLGRLIAGAGGALIPITVAETARTYPSSNLKRKFSLLSGIYNVGFTAGPGVILIFQSVDIRLGPLNIRYENSCAILMAVVMSGLTFICYFVLDDVSKLHDIKSHQDENSSKVMIKQGAKRGVSLYSLCFRIDVWFILMLSFFGKYFACTVDMWLTLLIIDVRHESIEELNFMMIFAGLSCVIVFLTFSLVKLSNSQIYYLSVLANVSFCGLFGVYLVFYFFPLNVVERLMGTLIYGIGFGCLSIADGIFVVNTMAIISPNRTQALAECIRVSFGRAGFLSALILSPWLFEWMPFVTLVFICIILCQAIFMLVRIKTLRCPKEAS